MKKIIVLGALGMAGHVIVNHLNKTSSYNVLGVARQQGFFVNKVLDVTKFSALEDYLTMEQPEYVMNCVGALVQHAENNTASAILLNSYLPHFLSELGIHLGYKTIHISTDCVFSGKSGGYIESDFRDGDTYYARSKALGEICNSRDLTIRTSIIGPELKVNGTGLFDYFLKQEGAIQGYTKSLWSGVTTLELAKVIEIFIQKNICGLYQVTNGKPINKYDLLMLFKKHTEKNIIIHAVNGRKTNKSFLDTRNELKRVIPDYNIMVSNMVMFMKHNSDLYTHYLL